MLPENIDTWVFDLDHTLYPPEMCVFGQIEQRMEAFISRLLRIPSAEARYLRDHWWDKYGTTLTGLMQEHDLDPTPFLDEVHDIDLSHMRPDPALVRALDNLPGRRVIFTNGSRAHGDRVSRARGIRPAFEAIYGIEDTGYCPKPNADAFARVFETAGIDPSRSVMVEDSLRNLKVPAQLGMTTILVSRDPAPAPDFVTLKTDDLAWLLARRDDGTA